MKTKLLLCFFLSFLSFTSRSDLNATIEYIQGLISEGKKVAILVVDMQTGFYHNFRGVYPGQQDDVLYDQMKLIDSFNKEEGVIFVDVNLNPQAKGGTLSEILVRMKKSDFYIQLSKNTSDAFYIQSSSAQEPISSGLEEHLNKKGIKDVFIMGYCDTTCVYYTAKTCAKKGFNVVVDRDLNIILHQDAEKKVSEKLFSYDDYLKETRQQWRVLQEELPNLNVTNPTRYCKP